MKKYIQILIWIISATLLIALLVFVSNRRSNMPCKSININITNEASDKYIDNKYVKNLIRANKIIDKKLDEINIEKIETTLKNNEYIEQVEVYKKINGILQIDIVQRMPIVRIINSYNLGYYIGKEGILMPTAKNLHRRMMVANGHINYSPNFDTLINIYSHDYDADSSILTLRSIHKLTKYINSDKFWKSQIQQIYTTKNQDFELIPLVGSHIIEFGKMDMCEEKFKNLDIMYQKGFSSVGWNKYKTVNLKYNKQVVCGK